MSKIFTIGETVYDIIFKNGQVKEGRPGGAMLNTAVSLGRLNVPVHLVTGIPEDNLGTLILDFLGENNVSTTHISRYPNAKSRVALAFLDDENNAQYSFYKLQFKKETHLSYPVVNEGDLILFGSYYAIKDTLRSSLVEFLRYAKKQKAILIYDPNFRKSHLNILDEVSPFIKENISLADIVKGSDEDFENIFSTTSVDDIYNKVKQLGCCNLIYTANKHGVHLRTKEYQKHYPVPKIEAVSTVGAGDSFNAGLIWVLSSQISGMASLSDLSPDVWDEILYIACEFGTHSCLSFDNYISNEFAAKYVGG